MKRLLAAVALAAAALDASAQAGPLPDCPEATQLQAAHLYGNWSAELRESGKPQLLESATLRFERNPDYAQSVSGQVRHGEVRALVSGDAEDGEFSLDESLDGVNISAVWNGTVVPGACGREVRGVWSDLVKKRELDFVLRKLPENSR